MARNKGKKLGGVPSSQEMRAARDELRRATQINYTIADAQQSAIDAATERRDYLSPVWSPMSGLAASKPSQWSGSWGFAACDTELGAEYALMRVALANIDTAREVAAQRGPPVDTDLLRAVIDVLDKAQMPITNRRGAVAGETRNRADDVTAFGVLLEARNAFWEEEGAFGGMVNDPDDDGGALLGALYRLRDLARRLGLGTLS